MPDNSSSAKGRSAGTFPDRLRPVVALAIARSDSRASTGPYLLPCSAQMRRLRSLKALADSRYPACERIVPQASKYSAWCSCRFAPPKLPTSKISREQPAVSPKHASATALDIVSAIADAESFTFANSTNSDRAKSEASFQSARRIINFNRSVAAPRTV